MPGNDAVLFFSETHVVEVKEIIMSGVFLADAVGSFAGWLSTELYSGSASVSVNTRHLSVSESQLWRVSGIGMPAGHATPACLSHPWLLFYCDPRLLSGSERALGFTLF